MFGFLLIKEKENQSSIITVQLCCFAWIKLIHYDHIFYALQHCKVEHPPRNMLPAANESASLELFYFEGRNSDGTIA